MGGNLRSGGLRYKGTVTGVNAGSAQVNLLHSYTGSGVVRFLSRLGFGNTLSVEIDGVHKFVVDNTMDNLSQQYEFKTSLKIYGSSATSPYSLVYQTGNNKNSQVILVGGTASAGARALQTSVTDRGYIGYAEIQSAGGKLVVDGVTLIDNQTSSNAEVQDIFFNTSFELYGVSQRLIYSAV